MAVLTKQASDVRFYETDLATFISSTSSGAVAQVLVSGKGPTEPTLFNDFETYTLACGKQDPKLSFDHYMAAEYYREGNQLWVVRALGTGYKTAGVVVKVNSSNSTLAAGVSAGLTNPTIPDWGTLVNPSETPLFLVYPKWGPGSYGNKIGISIESQNLIPPTSISGTSGPVGGFLPDGSFDYVVSAVSKITTTAEGESVASIPNSFVLASSTATNFIHLAWTAVPGAIAYKIYRKQSSATVYDLLATVGAAVPQYTDLGSAIPDSSKHPILSSAGLGAPNPEFVLKVYDFDVATTAPVESFLVSLVDAVDEVGTQIEIESRVNAFSKYIQVRSNIAALSTIPAIGSVPTTALLGGTAGSAPTSSDITTAWEKFLNKEKYRPDILMEWRPSDAVRKAVVSLAERRMDVAAFISAPSTAQEANQAIDDRNLTLNINSSFAAIFAQDVIINDSINGKRIYVPAVGTMAALYARNVRMRQPWFSIAGLNNGSLNHILGMRQTYSEPEMTNLVKAQVNYIRNIQGKGIALWEQFTMYSRDSGLQFLNVRFLLNQMKRSLYDYLVYFLQEQNDEILQRQIRGGLSSFLDTVVAGRGIKSYNIVISKANNPASFTASGILGIGIYIVPILSNREIRLTFAVGQEGLEISETEIANLSLN